MKIHHITRRRDLLQARAKRSVRRGGGEIPSDLASKFYSIQKTKLPGDKDLMSVCHNTNEFKKKFNKLQDAEKLVYLKCVSHLYNIAIHDDDNIDTLRERFRKQLLDIKMTTMVHFKSHRIVITKKKQPKLVVSEIEKNGLYLIILPDKQNKPFSSVVLTPYAAQIQFIEVTDSHKLKFKVVAPYGLLKPNIKEIHATANKKKNTIVFDNINDIMKKQATKSKKRRRRRY